jgi:hypothetical protein
VDLSRFDKSFEGSLKSWVAELALTGRGVPCCYRPA